MPPERAGSIRLAWASEGASPAAKSEPAIVTDKARRFAVQEQRRMGDRVFMIMFGPEIRERCLGIMSSLRNRVLYQCEGGL